MKSHEFEAGDEYEIGRGGIRLPKLEIKDGDFYPHDTVRFLEELWNVNEADGNGIGQPSKERNTGYFVVPATQDRPTIFAFGETTKGDGRYDSPVTTYQFFTPPTESGEFQLVMSFTHYSSRNCGFAGGRDSLVLQDHEGQSIDLSLYGYRYHGKYESDEFANYGDAGAYTYNDPESQAALQLLAAKTSELKNLLF